MLALQQALRDGVDITAAPYHITAKLHPRYPNLTHYSYDQLESDFSQQAVREARGIILDHGADLAVVCRGFDKFFNYGESLAAEIDWTTAKVQEKLDGSLCYLWYYGGKWHVSTTGTPDASGPVNDFGLTFAEYFWKTAGDMMEVYPFSRECTYLFELTGPLNRVVVQHKEASLHLIGVRHNDSGFECRPGLLDFPKPRTFPLSTVEEIVATFATMPPLEQEGYVVVDAQWRRIKVKSPQYLALHRLKAGASMRSLVDVARKGETSEVESAFPELGKLLEEARRRIARLLADLTLAYASVQKSMPLTMKEFAAGVEELNMSNCMKAALYNYKRGKTESFSAYVQSMQVDALMRELGYKE